MSEVRKLRTKAKNKQYEADQANKKADKLVEENNIKEEQY